MTTIDADRETDRHYEGLRTLYAPDDPRANGYVSEGFFRREQRLVHALLARHAPPGPVLDIACGSGLMLNKAAGLAGNLVFGVDFNAEACQSARQNGFPVVRGDAFHLPLADNSVAAVINCQFLNQQSHDALAPFIAEAARVLRPGGRLIVLWRGQSVLHRAAQTVRSLMTMYRAYAVFPQVAHSFTAVRDAAERAGLVSVDGGVTLPFGAARLVSAGHPAAMSVGASNCLVAGKPGGAG